MGGRRHGHGQGNGCHRGRVGHIVKCAAMYRKMGNGRLSSLNTTGLPATRPHAQPCVMFNGKLNEYKCVASPPWGPGWL